MKYRGAIVILLVSLVLRNTYADSDLAQKFSPVLILTEDLFDRYRVIKPESVEIVTPQYADSIRVEVHDLQGRSLNVSGWESFDNWDPPAIHPNVNFSENKFAFLFYPRRHGLPLHYVGKPLVNGQRYAYGTYLISPNFNYPGNTPPKWNKAYFGEGDMAGNPYMGHNFDNTCYVHISQRNGWEGYDGTVTVIQYFFFYPYNEWWNNHEGDWQRVNVVVSSRTAAAAVMAVADSVQKSAITDSAQVDSGGAVAGLAEKEVKSRSDKNLLWVDREPYVRIPLKICFGALTSVVGAAVALQEGWIGKPDSPDPFWVF